jgi:PAS domain S-box-containing protein
MPDKPRILVVDDEVDACVLIREFLSRQGYDIHIAATAKMAIAFLAENCFDLVLLDLVMPDVNGLQVMEQIQEQCPDTLVIIMTGYATIESAVEGLKKGAYHYLKKPLRPEELARTIENGLEYRRTRAERNQAEQELKRYRDHLEELVEERTTQLRRSYERLKQEIEGRRKTEKALNESEEKYRLVVDNANDGIFITQDGVIKFPNRLALTVTGYTQEELASIPFVHLIHPEDRKRVLEKYFKGLRGEEPIRNYSFRIITKKGEELWVEDNAVLTTWEGRPALLNLVRDVTVLKRLEAQLLQAQKLEAVGTLAGGIAHDFNNLLQAVQGYAELLLLDKDAQAPGHRELQEIMKAARKGSALVKQFSPSAAEPSAVPGRSISTAAFWRQGRF